MSTIKIDSRQLVRELERAGIEQAQAKAIVAALVTAQDTPITRDYLESNLNQIFAPVFADLLVIRWMMVFTIAGIFYLLIKS